MPFVESIKLVESVIIDKDTITVTRDDVLNGRTYIGKTKNLESGTIPINTEITDDIILNGGEEFDVPFGYNPSTYKIIAKNIEDQTQGDATAATILKDKVAWVNGEKVTGSMPNIGSVSKTLFCGDSYTIGLGYHDGTGVIEAASLAEQTTSNATADHLLDSRTAWVNGEKIVGQMPNIGSETATLEAGTNHVISKGYHDGTGIIKAQALSDQTIGTAESGDIKNGLVAWVNGEKVTGSMPIIAPDTEYLPLNGSFTIPLGYHDGNGIVTQNIPVLPAQTVAPGKDPITMELAGNYMSGNLTVTGVDALNYQRGNGYVKDSNGELIIGRALTVSTDNKASIKFYVDNWHDNATLNVYNINGSVVPVGQVNDAPINVNMVFDWKNSAAYSVSLGGAVSVSIGLEEGTNAHTVTISGITSGTVSITDSFHVRQFGDDHDA